MAAIPNFRALYPDFYPPLRKTYDVYNDPVKNLKYRIEVLEVTVSIQRGRAITAIRQLYNTRRSLKERGYDLGSRRFRPGVPRVMTAEITGLLGRADTEQIAIDTERQLLIPLQEQLQALEMDLKWQEDEEKVELESQRAVEEDMEKYRRWVMWKKDKKAKEEKERKESEEQQALGEDSGSGNV